MSHKEFSKQELSKELNQNFTNSVKLLPAFQDNYIFVVSNKNKEALVIDPGDGDVVLDFLKTHNLNLKMILVTHHHHDHIGGLGKLVAQFPRVEVFGPIRHVGEIPHLTQAVSAGESLVFGENEFVVYDLAGHTKGHIAYFETQRHWLFSGDVIFGLGCGRIFDGTFEQQYQSMQAIKDLPLTTLIYCAHEYTETNFRFLQSLGELSPEQKLYGEHLKEIRQKGQPSVPLELKKEIVANPFLLAKDFTDFSRIRNLRNQF
ncbi:hydroxyacylglutathione hydrolase [Pseudobdellovibrio exovorus]|uniref:Hydroxyacylglutathione hydrolase n=1 Tax=Pseudobdellovibrio exovorus JSS TaxID=1184267 RepID=M4V8B0_9BACT|nr:hydroxyacylglutathione hydrolase [Pseudobdellovibrio exovorus]AGH95448.1 hypothetical protein A11Q_1232 [Pseudobdellovibrio exovorus JSS]